jgi:hypothetical protein
MIDVGRGQICAFAGSPDVHLVLFHQGLERCAAARLQPKALHCDALLDPEQDPTPGLMSGDADTRLIADVSIVEFEHFVSLNRSSISTASGYLVTHMVTPEHGSEANQLLRRVCAKILEQPWIPLLIRSCRHTHV